MYKYLKFYINFVCLVALPGLLGSCGDAEPTEDLRRALLRSWGEDTLLPRYGAARAGAGVLGERVEALCASPDAEKLAAAQEAWGEARRPWKEAQLFSFGPYSMEPLRFGPKIDFQPAREESVASVLEGSGGLDGASVSQLGAAARGMAALEVLLWRFEGTPEEVFVPGSRRCAYLQGATEDLGVQLGALRAAWEPAQGGYLNALTDPQPDGYGDLQMALGEVVNRMGYLLENLRLDRLGRPLGREFGGSPQPEIVESRFSHRSIEDLRDNLRGLEVVWFGPGEPAGAMGLSHYIRRRSAGFDARFRAQLDGLYAALDAIDGPLEEAIFSDADDVQALIDLLVEAQRFVQVDVIGALGLAVGFNDNDGD
jgi:predicted lipoprotein